MNSSTSALKFTPVASAPRVSTGAVTGRPGLMARWGLAVWHTLEAVGHARARRELLTLADRWQSSQPELAAELRAAARRRVGA